MSVSVKLPSLSPTMEEATLVKWCVSVGDEINPGDIIAEIETDKAVMDLEAIDSGVVSQLLVKEGAQGILVNSDIAILNGETSDVQAPAETDAPEGKSSGYDAVFPDEETQTVAVPKPVSPAASHPLKVVELPDKVRATPLARRLARQFKVDLFSVTGTGPKGRIVRADVERASKDGSAPLSRGSGMPAGGYSSATPLSAFRDLYNEDDYNLVPLNSMRKTIAARMTSASRDIPHFPITVDCEIDSLIEQRRQLNDDLSRAGSDIKISLNDFVIRAAALTLMKVPQVNASYTDDGVMMHKHADISIAVAMREGLITPILRRADEKGLEEISEEVRDLADRAKQKRLRPEEYQGGTFSISNMGMFGLKDFVSIINPPQGAILSIGAINERAMSRNRQLYSAMVMTVTLVCDHRVIDGLPAAEFIELFKSYLENPTKMLL